MSAVKQVPIITVDTMDWSMTSPCADCPFLKSTPPEKKGLVESIEDIGEALIEDGRSSVIFPDGSVEVGSRMLHSCHKTDNRVTDGGFCENYTGPVKHCAGFMLMAKKSNMITAPMRRAVRKGWLDLRALKDVHKVHTFMELLRVLLAWAQEDEKA